MFKNHPKMSHSTLRAKRAPFTFRVDKNSLKVAKMANVANETFSGIFKHCVEFFLGSVSALTEVLLVNVMHFKSDWQNSFESETTKEDFQRTFGGPIQVDMMYGDFTNLGYSSREANNGAAQIVAIPFEDENYHMVLVLPSQERGNRGKIFSIHPFLFFYPVNDYFYLPFVGLSEFVAKDLKNLMSTIMDSESLPKTEAAVELPKFNIKTKVDLSSTLRKVRLSHSVFKSLKKASYKKDCGKKYF